MPWRIAGLSLRLSKWGRSFSGDEWHRTFPGANVGTLRNGPAQEQLSVVGAPRARFELAPFDLPAGQHGPLSGWSVAERMLPPTIFMDPIAILRRPLSPFARPFLLAHVNQICALCSGVNRSLLVARRVRHLRGDGRRLVWHRGPSSIARRAAPPSLPARAL